ncbi:NADPH-dependent F420 reductase [Cyclobacterium sp. SYSU L10401]|uniref:NADPH-dependent F420 reductase n=1 Tax=Cyclobacterium sp. SYSU L10401 TaxID=2678657 RepID=UPI0013D6BA10|nr:NAD(P)-binding domain-containing protein [Cyclobacterium sp. SYSU L10401]
MNIGILGGTNLATNLGNKFIGRGMDVVFGVREGFSTRKVEWKILKMQNHYVLNYADAITASDVVIICCENEFLPVVCDYLKQYGSPDKLYIDSTNGVHNESVDCNTTYIRNETGYQRIFKAFNNLGLDYPKSDPLELIKETYFCGDNPKDKQLLKKLIELIGFKAIDAGMIKNACLLEAVYHLSKEISMAKSGDCHFRLMSV